MKTIGKVIYFGVLAAILLFAGFMYGSIHSSVMLVDDWEEKVETRLEEQFDERVEAHFELNHTGCRFWNVLTPADEIGDDFWIGGWTKDCEDGLLQPVIEFGPEEEAVEVLSRMENYIAIRETEWNSGLQSADVP